MRRPMTKSVQMQQIVREAMRSGAVGFASSTSPAHNGEGGLPMPSRLAEDREMAALVNAMGESGRGVYMLTKGGHTAVPFLESLAASSGAARDDRGAAAQQHQSASVFDDLDDIAEANTRGRRLIGQVSCCPLTMDFTLASPYPVEGLQGWKPALGLDGDCAQSRARRHAVSRRAARRAARPALPSACSTVNGRRFRWWKSPGRKTSPYEQKNIARHRT